MKDEAIFSKLGEIFGEQHVLVGDAVGERYTHDWTKSFVGRALAVVKPATAEQISVLLAYCQEKNLPVIAQGGHTGLCGGATPDADGRQIILSLERMNAIRSVDDTARFMVAEAGCILADLQTAAAQQNLLFPLNLAAKGSCQLGGNLATNAGGLNVLRYGTTRDLCLGLEAVLPDGRILNLLSGLRKNNTGYDLKQLIIGSEGTLAVITAAAMRLFSPASPVLTAWVVPDSVDSALSLLNDLQAKTDDSVSAFEMMSQPQFDLLRHYYPQARLPFPSPPPMAVLVEVSGMNEGLAEVAMAALTAAVEKNDIHDVVVAQSETQRADFWQIRELSPAVNVAHGKWIRSDVALPLSALAAFVADLEECLSRISDGLYIIKFGHMGDGNLHVSARPKDQDPAHHPALAEKIIEAIYERVNFYGGSFSAEHGIGREKIGALKKYKKANALHWMQQIKKATDPHNIMGRGRLFDCL